MGGSKHKHRGPGHSTTNKVNPLLAKIDAAWEQECSARMSRNAEIDMIAMMLMCNDILKVGPGRADIVTNEFLANKMDIANAVIESAKDDPEILHPKKELATRLKKIYGPEKWEIFKNFYPMLKEYW